MTSIILGIDEVGRGPWAGPLVVGAVILGATFLDPENSALHDAYLALDDSKRLTPVRRAALSEIILAHAAASGLGWVSAPELDRYGLSASLKLATRRAVKQILATKTRFDEIIIDGTVNFLQTTPLRDRVSTLKRADHLVKEVAAASIIAKVARDQYMIDLAEQYPDYGFEKHVGYGTAQHRAALAELGPCPEHRLSFRPLQAYAKPQPPKTSTSPSPKSPETLCNFYNISDFTSGNNPTNTCCNFYNTTTKGHTAESAVKTFLAAQNHTLIAQNFRTKTYEIDLITTKNHKVYFTEVKYSRSHLHEGTPLVRITPEKQQRMAFAASAFLKSHPQFQSYAPHLAVAAVSGDNFQVETWFPLD